MCTKPASVLAGVFIRLAERGKGGAGFEMYGIFDLFHENPWSHKKRIWNLAPDMVCRMAAKTMSVHVPSRSMPSGIACVEPLGSRRHLVSKAGTERPQIRNPCHIVVLWLGSHIVLKAFSNMVILPFAG